MKLLKLAAVATAALIMVDVAAQAAPMPPVGQWQCYATNNRGMTWYQNSADRHRAITVARQRCYNDGSRHCYISKNDCRYNNGEQWTCRVRDHHDRTWVRTAMTAKEACHAAEHACRHWHNKRGMDNYMCKVVNERRT